MATLGPAVSSLRASLVLLDSSISILDDGVSDFPRLRKVLQTQQHFELVPETTLKAAQQSLADDISPAIEQLLSTAESYMNQLARKEQSLKARHELLEGRLGTQKSSGLSQPSKYRATAAAGRSAGPSDPKALQMKRLQQKKDQLQFAIERLELQGKQKERELRKSMAFVKAEG
ncbi:DASH complex subunit spc19 [Knufia obscura]|uniref:DASH complex subunit SPC19 n=2 Tax=Knufia TaxID=430999 RepID=A0AAN8ENT9_9EURO|nr:DASH complex subunit spc19 [Knufia obscura]KAK5955227.1 DASH complex subunit spc19 [Knufia fluminis]